MWQTRHFHDVHEDECPPHMDFKHTTHILAQMPRVSLLLCRLRNKGDLESFGSPQKDLVAICTSSEVHSGGISANIGKRGFSPWVSRSILS